RSGIPVPSLPTWYPCRFLVSAGLVPVDQIEVPGVPVPVPRRARTEHSACLIELGRRHCHVHVDGSILARHGPDTPLAIIDETDLAPGVQQDRVTSAPACGDRSYRAAR